MRRVFFSTRAPRVAIVGAGPSGFYVAKYLMRALPTVRVTLIERWPSPFGLVRFGVAPDHPEVKSVTQDFEKVASDDRFRYFGNVLVGAAADDLQAAELSRVVSVPALRAAYDAVVLTCGASGHSALGVPGEELRGVVSARDFVSWYNSEPRSELVLPSVADSFAAVVVGQGNVALDCARILASPRSALEATDINPAALDALERLPALRHVSVVGRRGSAQSAFTIKELRELTKLTTSRFRVDADELRRAQTPASLADIAASRALTRKCALLETFAESEEADHRGESCVTMRFLLRPKEFKPDPADATKLGSVVFERTRLEGDANRVVGTGELVELKCDLALVAVGYVASPPALADGATATRGAGPSGSIAHDAGRVRGENALYCAGWVKRGPSGIIGTNIACARETVGAIVTDLRKALDARRDGAEEADEEEQDPLGLTADEKVTTWRDWLALDSHERETTTQGAPRRKLTDVETMLTLARAAREASSSS